MSNVFPSLPKKAKFFPRYVDNCFKSFILFIFYPFYEYAT